MRIRFILLSSLFLTVGCVKHDLRPAQFDCLRSDLTIGLVESGPSSQCGVADGFIIAEAMGGEQPYRFALNAGESTTNPSFQSLLSGIYTITVEDARGCSAVLPNINISALNFSFTADIIDDTDCVGGNGSFSITVLDGQPPFQYSFNDEPFTDVAAFENLKAGSYRVVLKDGNDCSSALNVTIPRGDTGTSWENDIKPLVTTYCALSGCHNGKSRPDLRNYEKAYFYARQMKTLTADGSMPFEGSLTQSQINLIACWVDEGARNN